MTYNKQISVNTLRVIRPSPVAWVQPPAAVRRTHAVRLPFTHTHTHTHTADCDRTSR